MRQDTKPCQVPSTSSDKVPNTVVSRRGGWNSRRNVAASNKSVKEWLIAAKNASTPNKPVREETETPVNSPSPTLPSAAEPSNSATSEPNVAPEPQRNEGSAIGEVLDEFESTTSSFITNIDSFCRSQVEQGAQLEASTAGPSRLTSPQVLDEFESTTSSFMLNVDSFCGVNTPKDVGNDQNLESPKINLFWVKMALKSLNFCDSRRLC